MVLTLAYATHIGVRMSMTRPLILIAAALIGGLVAATTQAQTVDTRIGKLDFEHGVPTQATVEKLYDQMDFQRACQLYLWAMPLVQVGNLESHIARHRRRSTR